MGKLFGRRLAILVASLTTFVPSVGVSDTFRVDRIGPLNPNFDADAEDSITDHTAMFAPVHVIRGGILDDTLGDILIYNTERFINGSGNLGFEYTQVATNGYNTWNLNLAGGEPIGLADVGVDFNGRHFFRSYHSGPLYTDGVNASLIPLPTPSAGLEWGLHPGFSIPYVALEDRVLFIDSQVNSFDSVQYQGLHETNRLVTKRVDDTNPGGQPLGSPLYDLYPIDDAALLYRDGNLYRAEVQSNDLLVEPVQIGTQFGSPSLFTQLGSKVIFTNTGSNGRELHVIDGLDAEELVDLNPGTASANPFLLTTFADKIVFSAIGPNGREPYATDGETVSPLADINPGTAASDPRHFSSAGGKLFFTAVGPNGREVYYYDGSVVEQVTDLNPGPGDSFSTFDDVFYPAGDRMLFRRPGVLYTTDGETAAPLTNWPVGHNIAPFVPLIEFSGVYYFLAEDGDGNANIFRTDGYSVEGVTAGLPGVPQMLDFYNFPYLVALNDSLVFAGGDADDWALYRLTIVPEPSTASCGALCLLGILLGQVRKRCRLNG